MDDSGRCRDQLKMPLHTMLSCLHCGEEEKWTVAFCAEEQACVLRCPHYRRALGTRNNCSFLLVDRLPGRWTGTRRLISHHAKGRKEIQVGLVYSRGEMQHEVSEARQFC